MKTILKVILTVSLLIINYQLSIGQVGINDNNTSPDASAMLDVKSTTKGMLIPRMTTTERNAISSAATGLMIYNTTTDKFNYYNGTAWTVIGDDNLGDHIATQKLSITPNLEGSKITLWDGAGGSATNHYGFGISTNQINYHTLSNHVWYSGGTNGNGTEIMRLSNLNGLATTNASVRPLYLKSSTAGIGAVLEVNNSVNTRAIFGADGSSLTGGSTSDVIVGNWSNDALRLYSNATERVNISNTGLFTITGNLKVVDGTQAAGKVLVSDANGQATWTTLDIPVATPDTAQPVPIEYHGFYIYVHPTDNGTTTDWSTAKTTCENLTAFGKSDWYLPSRLELDAMYKQSFRITGLSQTEIVKYWSSTAKDATFAYTQRLDYGGPDPDAKTDTSGHNCRCVRKN